MQGISSTSEVKVIMLAGNVRMGDAVDRLRQDVDAALNSGQARIVVNMAAVRSIDSSAIGVLVRCLALAKQRGGSVKLVALPENPRNSLQLTGILKLFDVYDDDAGAIRAFAAT